MPQISANGLSFEYESLGNPQDPVILLVMGLGVQMVLWPDEFCQMLVDKGFRVVRFDNKDVVRHPLVARIGEAYDQRATAAGDKRREARREQEPRDGTGESKPRARGDPG